VSTFALSRLGFGVFTISPRLAPQQCQALLQGSGCLKVVQSGSPLAYDLGHMTQKLDPGIDVIPMIDEGVYRSGPDDRSSRNSYYSWISDDERHYSPAIIQHSSGSTGLPKAIYYPHKEVLLKFAIALSGATVCPLYHALALRTGLNAMIQGQLYYFANPHLSMTSDSLVEYLQATKAHIFWAGNCSRRRATLYVLTQSSTT
jgi:acyl-CoA synthetase (AMP-forming)/AMP-acid ligase II